MNTPQSSSAAEQTRQALVLAALRLFGAQGYDGTSTREIAKAARANIGSIAYHFGGKEGLRMAAADRVVQTIRSVAGPALGQMDAALAGGMDAEAARDRLAAVVERMVGFIAVRPEAGDIALFVLRELGRPTPALDRIYAGVFEPVHMQLCRLWERATGQAADAPATRLAVFTLIGQVVYFRVGREAVLRRMGWTDMGPAEAGQVVDAVHRNLDAMIALRKGMTP